MRIQVKILLALSLAMLILFATITSIYYNNLKQEVYELALSDARDIRALIMATRRVYHHQFLDSDIALTDKTVGFLPAHSLSRISEDFKNWANSGIRFNAVSDRPRNLRNMADKFELRAMQFFRQNPDEEEHMTLQVNPASGQEYYHYSRPIWIEQYCLKCHGKYENAPPAIRLRYKKSYNYQVGDLRGLMSIKLPISGHYEKAIELWKENILTLILILLVVWLALGAWFRRHIGLRLEKLQGIAQRIGRGDYSPSIEKPNNDEIGSTLESMNSMAERIFQREQSIKHINILYKMLSMTNELLLRRVSSEQIYREICHIAVTHGQFNLAWVSLIEPDSGHMATLAVEGKSKGFVNAIGLQEETNKAYPITIKPYIFEGRSVIINDLQNSDLSGHWRQPAAEFDILSTAQVPLIINAKVVGVLSVCADQCDYFKPDIINLLQEVCRDVAFALDINHKEQEHIAAAEHVNYLSLHDQLTHLPNRNWLLNRLHQVIAGVINHGHIGALLYIDLDNFKLINDTLGQQIGDEVLRQSANDIRAILPEEDSLVRGSADEFLLLLEEISDDVDVARQKAQALAQKIHEKLGHSRIIDQHRIDISVSIGIALFPLDSQQEAELIQCAATALHAVKQEGKNHTRLYHPEMQSVLSKRLGIESDLRIALENQEFEMYYQPKIYSQDNSLAGAEALIRWNHPEKGLVPPDHFIPVLEESGQIVAVGSWVLEEVFRQVSTVFSRQKNHQDGIRYAVNVSPRQFQQADFVEVVKHAIAASQVNPKDIELEITENLLISDASNIVLKMAQLKELGFHFSLDDFGTGYSSLAYLKQLPLDVIKIDRVFVSSMLSESSSADIVETILDIARRFHLQVIAEGVETLDELTFLKQRQCDMVQGYYYSKPLVVEEFMLKYFPE